MLVNADNNINWSAEWTQFKKGNQNSFRRIYDYFFDRLYWYGLKISTDTELVEDCIQELFLTLYTRRENLSETDNLEFYLMKSLKLTLYQKLRRQSVIDDLSQPLEIFSFQLVAENEENAADSEKLQMVQSCIENLSPAAREILYLKFYSNLDYRQIGKIVGIQPGSVKKQVYRIVGRLKEIVGRQYREFFCLCYKA